MSPELKSILSQAQQIVGVASLEENRQSQIQLISRLSNQTRPRTTRDDGMIQAPEQSINGYILIEPSSVSNFLQEH